MNRIPSPRVQRLKKYLLSVGWQLPLMRAISSRQPLVLLYHGVPAHGDGTCIDSQVFEQHIHLLKQHFDFFSVGNNYQDKRSSFDRIRIALTFDDGFRNNAEVVAPILRKYQIPACFFICTRHTTPGQYLWFSYLAALEQHFRWERFCFRGEVIDMSAAQRRHSIRRLAQILLQLTPHPSAMYHAIDEELPRLEDFVAPHELTGRYAGMTIEQVGELAADPLFSLGIHTSDHPFLTKTSPEEALRQIHDNKKWIEQLGAPSCQTIAYPGGDYDGRIIEQCKRLGLAHGYAVIPQRQTLPRLEIPRMGIYSPSLDVLGFKVQWSGLMRTLRLRVG